MAFIKFGQLRSSLVASSSADILAAFDGDYVVTGICDVMRWHANIMASKADQGILNIGGSLISWHGAGNIYKIPAVTSQQPLTFSNKMTAASSNISDARRSNGDATPSHYFIIGRAEAACRAWQQTSGAITDEKYYQIWRAIGLLKLGT